MGILLILTAASLTIALALSPDTWRSLLGGQGRRQGWITEITELGVLVVSLWAVSGGLLVASTVARLAVIAAAGVGASAVCQSHWVGFLDPTRWNSEVFNRVAGTIGGPSQLSTYLAVTIPITLGLAVRECRSGRNAAAILAAFVFVIEIVAITFARGTLGIGGAIVGIAVFCILIRASGKVEKWLKFTFVSLGVIVIILIILLNFPGRPLDRLTQGYSPIRDVAEKLSQATDFRYGSGRARALIGESTEKALAESPSAWIVGVGPDRAWDAIAKFDNPERQKIEGFGTSQDRPHQFLLEKLLSAGAPYAICWLTILALAMGLGLERAGIIKNGMRYCLLILFCGAIAFAANALAMKSMALSSGFMLLCCAVLPVMTAVWNQLVAWRKRDNTNNPDPIIISFVAAICAHWVAGSFGVSTSSERTLIWVVAAVLISNSYNQLKPSPNAALAIDISNSGLVAGAACLAVFPMYSYYGFGWSLAPRPVYAAAIVPIFILLVTFVLSPVRRIRNLIEAICVFAFGLAIFYVCVLLTPGERADAVMNHAAMSIFAPLLFMFLIFVMVFEVISSRDTPAQDAPDRNTKNPFVRRAAASVLLACSIVMSWIALRELQSDTTFFGALHAGEWARELEQTARTKDLEHEKRPYIESALEWNSRAHAMVARSREIGAPLEFLGSPSVLDRQIESQRPK
ncbi:MAG: hypothetical protein ACKVS6_11040 [Planctomycetota bacterium]